MKIKQDKKSWQAGYDDGLDGHHDHQAEATDQLAYSGGYVEGVADRKKWQNTEREKPPTM